MQEYLLFDPGYEEAGQAGRVQLFRRWGSKLVETGPGGPEGSDAELESEVLRVSFRAEGMRVRVRDLASGEDLLWNDEQALALQDSERQRDADAQARQDAERQRDAAIEAQKATEARIAELEALLRDSKRP